MLVHRTKKLLDRSTSVGSYIFPEVNRADPDQVALTELPDLGLLCCKSVKKGLYEVRG